MSRERLDLWCERGILGLLAAILCFAPLATGAVRPIDFLLVQGGTIAILVLWGFRFLLNPGHRLLWHPVNWAVLALVGYAAFRYAGSEVEYVARQDWMRLLVCAALFFAILHNAHRQETIKWMSLLLVFLGMGIAMYGVYQFITDSNFSWHFLRPPQYAGRASGTYICPNHFAGFLELVAMLGLALLVVGRLSPVVKVLCGYACLVMLAGIAVSLSRSGWVAAAGGLVVLALGLLRVREFRIPALAVILCLSLGAGYFFTQTFQVQQRVEQGLKEHDIRVELWKPAMRMWRENPWLGIGPGHYDLKFRQYRSEKVQARPERVHNDYLNILADWGVVGLALFFIAAGLLAGGAAWTARFVKRSSDFGRKQTNKHALLLGASAGLAALSIHGFTDYNFFIPANALVATFFAAWLASQIRFATDRFWVRSRLATRLAAAAACFLAAGYLGADQVRKSAEQWALWRGQSLPRFSREQLPFLQQAWKADPTNPETAYAIGETLRLAAAEQGSGADRLAIESLGWFERARRLNPYDPLPPMRLGMALHFLKRREEAAARFEEALRLDPHGALMAAQQGWHWIQMEDFARARAELERAERIRSNPISREYLAFLNERATAPAADPAERLRRKLQQETPADGGR